MTSPSFLTRRRWIVRLIIVAIFLVCRQLSLQTGKRVEQWGTDDYMAEEGRTIKKNKIKLTISITLWGTALLLSGAARLSGSFAQWYSTHVYPLLVGSVGRLTGYFPVSVSEMLLYLFLIYMLVWFTGRIAGKIAWQGAYHGFLNLFPAPRVVTNRRAGFPESIFLAVFLYGFLSDGAVTVGGTAHGFCAWHISSLSATQTY